MTDITHPRILTARDGASRAQTVTMRSFHSNYQSKTVRSAKSLIISIKQNSFNSQSKKQRKNQHSKLRKKRQSMHQNQGMLESSLPLSMNQANEIETKKKGTTRFPKSQRFRKTRFDKTKKKKRHLRWLGNCGQSQKSLNVKVYEGKVL